MQPHHLTPPSPRIFLREHLILPTMRNDVRLPFFIIHKDTSMSNNPFQPASETTAAPNSGGNLNLLNVARYQKGIIWCIFVQLLCYVLPIFLPPSLIVLVYLLMVGTSIGSLTYTVMLATQIYGTGVAILMGVLAIVPCVGLLPLLIINGKATSILRSNSIKVGLFGANISSIKQ